MSNACNRAWDYFNNHKFCQAFVKLGNLLEERRVTDGEERHAEVKFNNNDRKMIGVRRLVTVWRSVIMAAVGIKNTSFISQLTIRNYYVQAYIDNRITSCH